MKHCCLNCHFLAKESRDAVAGPHVFSWNSKDRNRKTIKDHYAAKCWWGIWDAGVDPKLTEKLMDIVNVSRANTCFFVEAHDGMQFEAAKELQNRKQENRELKRGRMFSTIGLWIAALGLVANLVFQLLKTFNVIG
jgi:hypothetical protein